MAEFFPIASPSDVRAERYNTGFSGATLDGCALDNYGNVILLDDAFTLNVTTAVGGLGVFATASPSINGQVFVPTTLLTKLEGTISCKKQGTGVDVTFEVYAVSDNKPIGGALKTVVIPKATFSTVYQNVPISITDLTLLPGKKYCLCASSNQGDGANTVLIEYSNSSEYADGGVLRCTSGNWDIQPTYNFICSLELGLTTTSGTVTEDIAVSSLAEWYKYYRKTTEPTNTSVSCAIKDTEDNVLIASVDNGDSLSAIDATTYKTIRVVHTLTRNSTSDDTPKLHYREVSWIGEELKYISKKHYYASHTLTTASARENLMIIENHSGKLSVALFSSSDTSSGVLYVTIDGVEYMVSGMGWASGSYKYIKFEDAALIVTDMEYMNDSTMKNPISLCPLPIYFKKEIKVDIKHNVAGGILAYAYAEVNE